MIANLFLISFFLIPSCLFLPFSQNHKHLSLFLKLSFPSIIYPWITPHPHFISPLVFILPQLSLCSNFWALSPSLSTPYSFSFLPFPSNRSLISLRRTCSGIMPVSVSWRGTSWKPSRRPGLASGTSACPHILLSAPWGSTASRCPVQMG